MVISQDMLQSLLDREEHAKCQRAEIKERLIAKEAVEPGPLFARISAQQKRTPDYKGFITANLGPEAIFKLMDETKPTSYIKMYIGLNKKGA